MKKRWLPLLVILALAPLALVHAQEPAQKDRGKSAVPGINERFLQPDLNVREWEEIFEGESREIFTARNEVLAAAGHRLDAEAAAVGEHRIDGLVRGVLGQERRRHAAAVPQHRRQLVGEHRLAPQYSGLIGERQADHLKLARRHFLDHLGGGGRGVRVIEAVTGDEAGGV